MVNKTLVMDLSASNADTRIRKNILAARAAIASTDGTLDERNLIIRASNFQVLDEIPNTKTLLLYSTQPVNVTTRVAGNVSDTVFSGQTLTVITSGVGSVRIENAALKTANVSVIRLAEGGTSVSTRISRRLITFAQLSRIAPIGASVTTLAKLLVQDVTLATFVNDQVLAPGSTASHNQKYRLCDSDGTANATGAYIMYLDDVVTQQNFSGTLQLWVEEVL